MLKVENISVNINNADILKDISFNLNEHEILVIIGPNGAGKTTLIKAIMNNIKHSGTAFINGMDTAKLSSTQLARQIGVLTQGNGQFFPFSVYEVVSLGRYAYQKGLFSKLSKADREKIDKAISLTGISHLKDRPITTLSGGELQRVFLAAVFAQEPNLLLLDEPTSHLDLQYQLNIFDTIKEWVKGQGRAAIAVVHDLNLAFSYASKTLLMNKGSVFAFGKVDEVLCSENLKKVYEVDIVQWMQKLLDRWK